ncbi:MAG TPA: YifB family Mg chelatase-like AAA ATPase, partial [Ramlibacter sp.]|nr:YifB family Mg chelatase-like AAA ATPase [Ramlibacter sp.]
GNGPESALARGVETRTARTLLEVCGALDGRKSLPLAIAPPLIRDAGPDIADVRGQAHARRALEVAAAGAHHILLIGPPGSGKTLLASRLPGLLPEASEADALEAAAIASVAGAAHGGRALDPARWRQRPFRSPHHTASAVALVGGGSEPRPGEISLAHRGVLFLDELPEWDRRALEVLREPLESGVVTVSRAARSAEFPARFQLVAAMNPCPCGWLGSGRACRCSPDQVARYQGRLSGPLLDRIDLHVEVPALRPSELLDAPAGEATASVQARCVAARAVALQRQGGCNHALQGEEIDRHAALSRDAGAFLRQAAGRLGWSARSTHRVLTVARTIADLARSAEVEVLHVAEAVQYRRVLPALQ